MYGRSLFVGLILYKAALFGCTGVALKTTSGEIVSGRTVEFGINLEGSILYVPRAQSFVTPTTEGEGMSYEAKYAALGIMAFQNHEIMDGLNEKGLVAGAFYFPTFAIYPEITDENLSKMVSPIGFVNWILTQFATVDEVKEAVAEGEVVIGPILSEGWGSEPAPMHYIVYDRQGKALVIEPVEGQLRTHEAPLGVITNSPPYEWHTTHLRNYIALNPFDVPPIKLDGETLLPLGQGSGLVGLPGDFTPPSRFLRAAIFSASAVPVETTEEAVLQVFHLLNNFDIPKGSVKEREEKQISYDTTLYTTAKDPKKLRYYFRSYQDQSIRVVDLTPLLSHTEMAVLPIRWKQPILDMTRHMVAPHSL